MNKLLIILAILAFLLTLFYLRYRRQILAAREIYRAFRDFQKKAATTRGQNDFDKKAVKTETTLSGGDSQTLRRCASCGEWVAENRAIKFGSSNQSFCSTKCLENMAVGR